MPPPPPQVGTAAITENLLKRRWSANILRYLANGISDPAEITRHEPLLTPAVMTERLRAMLRFDLVARFPRPLPSKVVEFRLTLRGKRILRMLELIERLDQFDQRQTVESADFEEYLGIDPAPPSGRSPQAKTSSIRKPSKASQSLATTARLRAAIPN